MLQLLDQVGGKRAALAKIFRKLVESQRSPGAPEVSFFKVCSPWSCDKSRWSGPAWTMEAGYTSSDLKHSQAHFGENVWVKKMKCGHNIPLSMTVNWKLSFVYHYISSALYDFRSASNCDITVNHLLKWSKGEAIARRVPPRDGISIFLSYALTHIIII